MVRFCRHDIEPLRSLKEKRGLARNVTINCVVTSVSVLVRESATEEGASIKAEENMAERIASLPQQKNHVRGD
jgi:hypothetical protein